MKLDFNLPKIADVSKSSNCTVNLRERYGVLTPCGTPPTVQSEAGVRNFRLPSGRILSVGADRHDLMIDGELIGSLSSPFGALLPEGPGDDCIILTTNSAPEWLIDSELRGKFTPLKSEINLSAVGEMTMEQSVEALKLSGSYPRASGELTAPDLSQAHKVLKNALTAVESRAAGAGMRVQPVWMAWQILDAGGKVISRSEPMLVQSSAGFQATGSVKMTLTRKDGKFTSCSAGSLTVKTYEVKLKIARSEDSWRRQRAAQIEILASPALEFITGAMGAFNQVDSTSSTLFISPLGADSSSLNALKERTRASFAQTARVIARIDHPLEGVEQTIGVSPLDDSSSWTSSIGEPNAVCAYRGGSAVVYADSRQPGILLAAPSLSPLSPIGSAKVSTGRIEAIMAPVGNGGGWNYGRYHLLVFATDGVYAVSIDRTLRVISSQQIHGCGVSGPESVARAFDAIYFADSRGELLRLKGSKIEYMQAPFAVASVGFSSAFSELWISSTAGQQTASIALPSMKCTLRSDLHAVRFEADGLAVDTSGALRDLHRETARNCLVEWTRRIETDFQTCEATWQIDSAMVQGLELTLATDGGGAPQRVNQLRINGRINAPLRLKIYSPARPYVTVSFRGIVSPDSRFRKIKF
ncbi:MAG: hypothetical protein K2K82_03680 [Muribaculaceae bacterium]|nr:hypothetical protein [Muribaculaceae bacterium]